MPEWLHQLHTPEGIEGLIAAGGLLLLAIIIFSETGILAGFFLPGDSLLVTAGVFCALDPRDPTRAPPLDLTTCMIVLSVAAIAGDWLNFHLGAWTGNRIWQRPDGRFFKRRYLIEAQDFYARHGGLALAAARFIPIARTFVPFAAGMARMPYRAFVIWNIGGAVVWVCSLLALGWWLGQNEVLRERLHLIILIVIAVSLLPIVFGVLKRLLRKPAAEPAPPPGNS